MIDYIKSKQPKRCYHDNKNIYIKKNRRDLRSEATL